MEAAATTNGGSTTSNEEAPTNGGSATSVEETHCRPSLNSLALMRKATTPDNISSVDVKDWHLVIYEGVLLKDNTQKFWVDKKFHKNCFLVFPKACDIPGSNEESCWSWITKEEKWFSFGSTVDIPVPKSKALSWLLIQGRFETRALSPNTSYEVAFVVQVVRGYHRSNFRADLELDLPDGTKQTHREDLESMPEFEWINVRAGEFMMGPKTVGTIIFALRWGLLNAKWSLILKGVRIHPKD